jgi:hypothetical protein
MSRVRLRAALIVVGGAGTLLFGVSAPALAVAAGSATARVDSPADSSRVTATTQVKATVDRGGGTLRITGPNGYNYSQSVGASSSAQSVSCSFDPRSNGCLSGAVVLPNGAYSVTAASNGYTTNSGCGTGGLQSCTYAGSTTPPQTFILSASPAAPTGVDASQTGPRDVRVSWTPNPEPDITSYDLLDGSAAVLISQITCSGSDCHVDLTYPGDDPGGAKDFKVRAWRSDGDGGQVSSAPSGTASVTLPPPASSTAGGTGGSGGSTGSTSGGSTSGGSTSGGSTSGGSGGGSGGSTTGGGGSGGVVENNGSGGSSSPSFNGYSGRPGLGLKFTTSGGGVTIPHLPSNPGPKVAIPEGTYGKTLGYGDQVDQQKVREQTLSTRFVTTLTAFTDGDRLWKSLAGALVLVLIGTHLRLWSRSAAYE